MRQVESKSPIRHDSSPPPYEIAIERTTSRRIRITLGRNTGTNSTQSMRDRCWRRRKILPQTYRRLLLWYIYIGFQFASLLYSQQLSIHSIDILFWNLQFSSSNNEQHGRASHGGSATAPVFPLCRWAASLCPQHSFSAASRVYFRSRMCRHFRNHVWLHSADEALNGHRRGFHHALVCALWLHPSLFWRLVRMEHINYNDLTRQFSIFFLNFFLLSFILSER